MGMAAVIPADKIRETIMQKKFEDDRKQQREKSAGHKAKDAGKPSARSARPDVEFTKEDMADALRRASRKAPEDKAKDSETSE
jgi:hypothetical protein